MAKRVKGRRIIRRIRNHETQFFLWRAFPRMINFGDGLRIMLKFVNRRFPATAELLA
jgi:hypothetical protein